LAEADSSSLYDRAYYESHCGIPYQRDEHWLGFFAGIAEAIVETIHPAAVLDAGCAMGFLVEALRDRGVAADGVDISDYAISQVREDVREFTWVGSITDPLPRRYDLIVSIEVLEHLDEADGKLAVANLCSHTDDILFSSSPHDEEEETHANVRPTEYWARLFNQHGFLRDPEWEPSGGLPVWTIRFRRRPGGGEEVLENYERLAYRQVRRAAQLVEELRAETARADLVERMLTEREAIIADKDVHIQNLEAELDRIRQSPAYRVLRGVAKPLGSAARRLKKQ